ncbi:hypothetical protein F4777DRAFT_340335 [Nemania sp. FL0916]|nr:hypothetical protein F4777DRAFT_340335 [Nemania sp. FL0916]
MANRNVTIDHNQAPAVANAIGHVGTDGQFYCTRLDRHGTFRVTTCGASMANKPESISSHVHKIHSRNSSYHRSQAEYAKLHNDRPFVCMRPKLDGSGVCKVRRTGWHSFVTHAHADHNFKGNSASLTIPWAELSDDYKAYWHDRIDLEKRRLQNGGIYTPEDDALSQRFSTERCPNF